MKQIRKLFSKSQKLPAAHYLGPKVFNQQKKIDLPLFLAVLALSVFGLVMVYNSSQVEAYKEIGDKYYFIRQQIIWMILGLSLMAFFIHLDYHKLQKLALMGLVVAVVLLFMVFLPMFGVSSGGAHRWLKFGPATIQPAEIAKLALIVYFSIILQSKILSKRFLILSALVIFLVGVLQKDLGSALVISLFVGGMFFVSGAPVLYFIGFFCLGLLSFIGFILSSSYRKQRVLAFLDPFADPQGYSYHIAQVLIALGSGGWFGLGLGQSRQKYAYIPEVTTDSIFSVIGEELGFFGSAIIIGMFGLVIVRSLKIVEGAPDEFGRLLGAGLTLWLGTQAAVNLAAMVSLIPLTGVPLPFISYGGSALLANLVAVGILLNISKQVKV